MSAFEDKINISPTVETVLGWKFVHELPTSKFADYLYETVKRSEIYLDFISFYKKAPNQIGGEYDNEIVIDEYIKIRKTFIKKYMECVAEMVKFHPLIFDLKNKRYVYLDGVVLSANYNDTSTTNNFIVSYEKNGTIKVEARDDIFSFRFLLNTNLMDAQHIADREMELFFKKHQDNFRIAQVIPPLQKNKEDNLPKVNVESKRLYEVFVKANIDIFGLDNLGFVITRENANKLLGQHIDESIDIDKGKIHTGLGYLQKIKTLLKI